MSASPKTVLAIRPEPGLSSTLALGQSMGLAMHGCALSRVVPVAWDVPDLEGFDALLIGSANAMRLAGGKLARLKHLPVHAVGEATAHEAKAAGFNVELVGKGGLQTVIDAVNPPKRYLRLVSNEYVDLRLPEGISFEPVQVYVVEPLCFDESMLPLFTRDITVLLHSAAMTRQFLAERERLRLDCGRITLAAMGPRIVEPVLADGRNVWAAIHTAPQPSDEALLAMVAAL